MLTRLSVAGFGATVPFRFDVIHFHGGSLLPPRFGGGDAKAYRRLQRKVVIEFWGSDARLDSIEAARNPFYIVPKVDSEKNKTAMLRQWAEITDGHVIFPDNAFDVFLKPHFEHVHVVRHCVDTRTLIPRYPDPDEANPLVVHAPSNPELKGTAYVRQAVEKLRPQGLRFRYLELTGSSHESVVQAVRQADLVVDQLILGSHGILTVEAMSLGKPVLCYILPELLPSYPKGFPVISATPNSVTATLAEWLTSPERRSAAGRASRAYAERVHDFRTVAADALAVYSNLP